MACCSCLPLASVLQFHMHRNKKSFLSFGGSCVFPATTHYSYLASGWPSSLRSCRLPPIHSLQHCAVLAASSGSSIIWAEDTLYSWEHQYFQWSLGSSRHSLQLRPGWLRPPPGALFLSGLPHREQPLWLLLGSTWCGMPTSSLCWVLQTCAVWKKDCKLLCFFL